MNKTYRGAYERMADRMIAGQAQTIEINWINMSAKEAGNGGADRVTAKLVAAGYRLMGVGVRRDTGRPMRRARRWMDVIYGFRRRHGCGAHERR